MFIGNWPARHDLSCWHHHHHHHIHFRALFSFYRGLGFLTSLSRRRPLHSERFWGSAESIPGFFLSFSSTSSHDFLGLPDLFCATTFSLRTSAIQPVLRSTCPNHLILLVRSTSSKSWMPSFVRRESELTSSFALTLQIQRTLDLFSGEQPSQPHSWPGVLHDWMYTWLWQGRKTSTQTKAERLRFNQ